MTQPLLCPHISSLLLLLTLSLSNQRIETGSQSGYGQHRAKESRLGSPFNALFTHFHIFPNGLIFRMRFQSSIWYRFQTLLPGLWKTGGLKLIVRPRCSLTRKILLLPRGSALPRSLTTSWHTSGSGISSRWHG